MACLVVTSFCETRGPFRSATQFLKFISPLHSGYKISPHLGRKKTPWTPLGKHINLGSCFSPCLIFFSEQNLGKNEEIMKSHEFWLTRGLAAMEIVAVLNFGPVGPVHLVPLPKIMQSLKLTAKVPAHFKN